MVCRADGEPKTFSNDGSVCWESLVSSRTIVTTTEAKPPTTTTEAKPPTIKSFAQVCPPERLARVLSSLGVTSASSDSTGLASTDSVIDCSCSFSGGMATDGRGIFGIASDRREIYSGLAGSVGNLLPPSKMRSMSENSSSISLSASASADQGWMGGGAVNGSLILSLVLTS